MTPVNRRTAKSSTLYPDGSIATLIENVYPFNRPLMREIRSEICLILDLSKLPGGTEHMAKGLTEMHRYGRFLFLVEGNRHDTIERIRASAYIANHAGAKSGSVTKKPPRYRAA